LIFIDEIFKVFISPPEPRPYGIVKAVFWFAAEVSHTVVLHPPMVFFVDEIQGYYSARQKNGNPVRLSLVRVRVL